MRPETRAALIVALKRARWNNNGLWAQVGALAVHARVSSCGRWWASSLVCTHKGCANTEIGAKRCARKAMIAALEEGA